MHQVLCVKLINEPNTKKDNFEIFIYCFQINLTKCAKEFYPIQNYQANTIIVAVAAALNSQKQRHTRNVETMSPGMNNNISTFVLNANRKKKQWK